MNTEIIHFLVGLWHNKPLIAALFAIVVTQLLKVPVHYFLHGSWDMHKVIDAGGMPSSHAAGVVALVAALSYVVGTRSATFAVAVVFAAIVMYDAGGIRRHAGEHAVLLNRIAMEMSRMNMQPETSATTEEGERLKEILGHEPPEVVVGAIVGLIVGVAFGKWWL